MPPEKSTFAYPNKFARIYLEALEEILGRDDLHHLLRMADLDLFIRFQPPDNMEKGFDFAYLTAIEKNLREVYGQEQGNRLAHRAGRATFAHAFRAFGEQLELSELKLQHMDARLDIALPMMAEFFTRFSDQVSSAYAYDEERFVYTLERCPLCWNLTSQSAFCHTGQGLLQEALYWLSDGKEFHIEIAQCIATGDEMGRYVIYREPF